MVLMATDLPEPVVPAIRERHARKIDDHRLAADLAEAEQGFALEST